MKHIAIRIGDQFLDLPKDLSVELEMNNPLLNENNLSPGSVSLPFDLPSENASPKNGRLLNVPDVLENVEGFRKIDAELLVSDIPLKKGKLIVREASRKKISANFNFGLANVADDFKTKKIRSLLDETITIGNGAIEKCVYLKLGGASSAPYSISINGNEYQGSSLAALSAQINANTKAPLIKSTVISTGTTPLGYTAPFLKIEPYINFSTPNSDPLAPLHVDVSEDNGSAATGYKWYVEGFDPTSYYNQFTSFLTPYWSAVPPNDKVRFPFLFNEDLHDSSAPKSTKYVNCKNTAGLLRNSFNYGVGVNVPFLINNTNSLQPFIRLRYVLDTILNYFGMQVEGDWIDADVNNMLIWNTESLDVPMNFIGKQKFIFWARSFNLKNLVPDITVVEFLTALQSRYNLGIYYNELSSKLRIVKREVIAKNMLLFDDITAKCGRVMGRNDMRLTGFRLSTPRDEKDSFSTVDEISIGEVEKENTVKLGGMSIFDNQEVVDGVVVSAPIASQRAGEKFNFRIFYDRGYINGGPFSYNACSINAVNYTERFEGVNGVYEKFWKYWIYFELRRRSISIPVNFRIKDLNRLNWEVKKVVDRNRFMVKKIKIKVTMRGLRVSDVELYTMI